MFRHNDSNCCDFLALALGNWNVIYLHLLALIVNYFPPLAPLDLLHFFFTGVIDFLTKNLSVVLF